MSYKSILKDYIILIALCLFVLIYIIINLEVVKRGDIYTGDLTKSIFSPLSNSFQASSYFSASKIVPGLAA